MTEPAWFFEERQAQIANLVNLRKWGQVEYIRTKMDELEKVWPGITEEYANAWKAHRNEIRGKD